MPTYDYECRSCGAITEVIHSMLEDGPTICERCGGTLRRILYPTGIIFKGSGFYSTDSRSSQSASSGGGTKKEASEAASSSSDGSSPKDSSSGATKDTTSSGSTSTSTSTSTGSSRSSGDG